MPDVAWADLSNVAAMGRSTMTWPGGSPISNLLTVAHGLGSTPSHVFATMHTTQGAVVACHADANGTNVTILAEYVNAFSPALGATATVDWIAFK